MYDSFIFLGRNGYPGIIGEKGLPGIPGKMGRQGRLLFNISSYNDLASFI
jgi:hypothetical protein